MFLKDKHQEGNYLIPWDSSAQTHNCCSFTNVNMIRYSPLLCKPSKRILKIRWSYQSSKGQLPNAKVSLDHM